MLGQLPQLYVGHCTFDLEHWADALEAFRRVDARILRLAWPAWRALKRRDLEAECFRRLGLRSEAIAAFRTLMEEARSEKRDGNFVGGHEVDCLIKAAAGELSAELCEEAWGFLFEVGVFKVDEPDEPDDP
jgi:hypothetical protein